MRPYGYRTEHARRNRITKVRDMVDLDCDEIWLVFYQGNLIATVDSERLAEELCIVPEHMTWKRFVVAIPAE